MFINFKGKELELSFGLKFLRIIDKTMAMEAENISFGQGTQMLVPRLEMADVVSLSYIIEAATSHHQKAPKTEDELEVVIEEIATNYGIEEFCQDVLKELGKRAMTRNLVPDEYKEEKKATK
ncbi:MULTISPECIES: tail assembly chaperone [Staphylococcus]|uniref:tail assembly chaperone n=1 Tax=Staphylococcus TaxID=1279 RepID=UPI000914A23A|nr:MULTISPECIES: tail assembly chaperone [Staphylococcus]SGT33794.1 phage protein [Staphylococcus aureus]SGW64263.1 phage protein [Staphylococcus argenteus]HDP2165984.1 tail assembly chaperone [Staphylococcus aureus]